MLRDFLSAVQFLTRIPVPTIRDPGFEYRDSLRRSLIYFPLVGLLIATFSGFAYWALCFAVTPLIAAFLAISAEVILTGGFHEDAFADSADALGGGWTREQVLEILKDSRHGTYGVLALVLGVGLRIALVAQLEGAMCWIALPLSGFMGRWAILWMMYFLMPISDRQTMVKDVGGQPSLVVVLASCVPAMLGMALIGAITFSTHGFADFEVFYRMGASIIAVVIGFTAYVQMIQKRVNGTTGDFLGAICYLVQLIVLLAFA